MSLYYFKNAFILLPSVTKGWMQRTIVFSQFLNYFKGFVVSIFLCLYSKQSGIEIIVIINCIKVFRICVSKYPLNSDFDHHRVPRILSLRKAQYIFFWLHVVEYQENKMISCYLALEKFTRILVSLRRALLWRERKHKATNIYCMCTSVYQSCTCIHIEIGVQRVEENYMKWLYTFILLIFFTSTLLSVVSVVLHGS